MRLTFVIFTILIGSWGLLAQAKPNGKAKSQSVQKVMKKSEDKNATSGLKKEFRFSALDVNGRYQTAGSMDTKVETEKVLTDILSLRTDFKDRVLAETKRR